MHKSQIKTQNQNQTQTYLEYELCVVSNSKEFSAGRMNFWTNCVTKRNKNLNNFLPFRCDEKILSKTYKLTGELIKR